MRPHGQAGKLTGQTDPVYSVAFSPDGTLASGEDTAIRLWEGIIWRDFAELENEVCRLTGTGLSKTEWDQYGADIPYRKGC